MTWFLICTSSFSHTWAYIYLVWQTHGLNSSGSVRNIHSFFVLELAIYYLVFPRRSPQLVSTIGWCMGTTFNVKDVQLS